MARHAPFISMIRLVMLCTLFTATGMLYAATEGLLIQSGPWIVQQEDGSVRIAFEATEPVQSSQIGFIHITRLPDTVIPVVAHDMSITREVADQNRVSHRLRNPTRLISFDIPQDQATPGDYEIRGLGHQQRNLPFSLQAPPKREEETRIAVMGAYNYPSLRQIRALEKELGGPLHAALLLGVDGHLQLGTGGWENHIPIYAMRPSNIHKHFQAMIGEQHNWTFGCSIGHLDLPTAPNSIESTRIIAESSNDWQIYVEPVAPWDPGLLHPNGFPDPANNSNPIGLLLSSCLRSRVDLDDPWSIRYRVPLILTAGHSSAFISEPLVNEVDHGKQLIELAEDLSLITNTQLMRARNLLRDQRITAQRALQLATKLDDTDLRALSKQLQTKIQKKGNRGRGIRVYSGGTRYVSVSAAGGSFHGLSKHVALPIYHRALFGLRASSSRLDAVFTPAQDPNHTIRLSWNHINKKDSHLLGWGYGNAKKNVQALLNSNTSKSEIPELIRQLQWINNDDLANDLKDGINNIALLDLLHKENTYTARNVIQRLMCLNDRGIKDWLLVDDDSRMPYKLTWLLRSFSGSNYSVDAISALVLYSAHSTYIHTSLIHWYHHQATLREQERIREWLSVHIQPEKPEITDILIRHAVYAIVFSEQASEHEERFKTLALHKAEKERGLTLRPIERYLTQVLTPVDMRRLLTSPAYESILPLLLRVMAAQHIHEASYKRLVTERISLQLKKSLPFAADHIELQFLQMAFHGLAVDNIDAYKMARKLKAALPKLSEQAPLNRY